MIAGLLITAWLLANVLALLIVVRRTNRRDDATACGPDCWACHPKRCVNCRGCALPMHCKDNQ